MANYDVIVVGGGHNGLTCAAYLGKAGRKVLVLEGRDVLGGLAVGPMLGSTRAAGPLSDAARFRSKVIDDLALQSHGLKLERKAMRTAVVGDAGRLVLSRDVDETCRSIAEISKKDGEHYRDYRRFLDAVAPVVRAFIDRPPLDFVDLESQSKIEVMKRALGLRGLGRERMLELFRVAPMSAADWLSEWFESSLVCAGIALPALALAYAGPRAPGTATNVLLAETATTVRIAGGGAAVAAALEGACKGAGVEMRTGSRVARLTIANSAVSGVELEDGDRISAGTVVCACDPRTALLDLVPPGQLPGRTEWRIGNWRARGTLAHLAVKLEGNVDFGDADRLLVVDDLDDIEKAFDAVKYRQVAQRPVLEVDRSSAEDGGSTLSIKIHHVAHERDGGYDESTRAALSTAVLDRLEGALGGVRDRVRESVLWCPPDIATELGTSGGHIGHGEVTLDQLLVRPIPECSQYRSPIASLFLASSGCHGGGELSGLPGAHAARAVLQG